MYKLILTTMEALLEKLSKEDLITVIANMHDTIQDWSNGWGFSSADVTVLNNIGAASIKYVYNR